MASVHDTFGYRVPRINGDKTKTSHAVGIEVELERVYILKEVGPWKILDDGSLKLEGREFTIPVWHDAANVYLKYLFDSLKTYKATKRCSVHIHTDISDYSIEELKTLVVLYILYEEALYNFSGRRWDSNFCVPVRTHFTGNISDLQLEHLSQWFPKYSGLHFFPDDKLATVEFRHMLGTTNIDYIVNWINILVTLVKAAKEISYEELITKVETMYTDSSYWELAKMVFGEYYKVINYNTFKEDTEHGVLLVKLLTKD